MFPFSDMTRGEETIRFLVDKKQTKPQQHLFILNDYNNNDAVRSRCVDSCLLSSVWLVILNISGSCMIFFFKPLNVSHKRESAAVDGHFNHPTETLIV